jgi:hypothetical protein
VSEPSILIRIAFRLTSHVRMCEQHTLQSGAPWGQFPRDNFRPARHGPVRDLNEDAAGRGLVTFSRPRDALNNSAISDGFGKAIGHLGRC